ncbi:hypothetical protein BKA93DRAFT_504082 [Sparassis latifolia]
MAASSMDSLATYASYPIIGHLRAFSFTRQPELFCEWTAKYGDIFHLRILGRNIVILNSLQVATDLMDKRGASTVTGHQVSCSSSWDGMGTSRLWNMARAGRSIGRYSGHTSARRSVSRIVCNRPAQPMCF